MIHDLFTTQTKMLPSIFLFIDFIPTFQNSITTSLKSTPNPRAQKVHYFSHYLFDPFCTLTVILHKHSSYTNKLITETKTAFQSLISFSFSNYYYYYYICCVVPWWWMMMAHMIVPETMHFDKPHWKVSLPRPFSVSTR